MKLGELTRGEAAGVPQPLLTPLMQIDQYLEASIEIGRVFEHVGRDLTAVEILAQRLANLRTTRAMNRREEFVPSRREPDLPAIHSRSFVDLMTARREALRHPGNGWAVSP